MSDPILPLAPIAEGTTQIDIEANDNFLRLEALSRPCLGVANDAAGGDTEGDVWLVGGAPTGAFATFDEDDIAIFDGTGWHAWVPVEGLRLVVNDVRKMFDGGGWIDDPASGGGSGDVTGPGSSTDNALARFDGTDGKKIQSSGVTVSDSDEIAGYRGNINTQTGTTYSLQASDSGKVVELVNASAITLTVPATLPKGFCCTLVQGGAGQVTVTAGSGATARNRQSHTKLAGQWAMGVIAVRANSSGSAAEYILGGDTAA